MWLEQNLELPKLMNGRTTNKRMQINHFPETQSSVCSKPPALEHLLPSSHHCLLFLSLPHL
jgi:hypothetical protein